MVTKTKKIVIGGSLSTILTIIFYLSAIQGVVIKTSEDIVCAGTITEPCVSYFNITSTVYALKFYNVTEQKLTFSPEVKEYKLYRWYYNKWAEIKFPINMTKGTTYRFKLVGYKYSPTDTVKWGVYSGDAYADPLWLNGTSADAYYETDEGVNITCANLGCSVTMNNTDNITSNPFYWNARNSIASFNDSLKAKNFTFAAAGNQLAWLSNLHRNDSINYAYLEIKGFNGSGGVYPENISIDLSNDRTNDVFIFGQLREQNIYINKFNNSQPSVNLTFTGKQTVSNYFRVGQGFTATSATMNLTGVGGTNDLIVDGVVVEMCGEYPIYNNVILQNGGNITVCAYNGNATSGWIKLTAIYKIDICPSCKISASAKGYRGSTGDGESYDGTPGTGGGYGVNCYGTSGGTRCSGAGGAGYGGIGGVGGTSVEFGTVLCGAYNGTSYGNATDYSLMMGSAGGGNPDYSVNGGNGGGYISLNSTNITIRGVVEANGGNAGGFKAACGSAGTILLYGQDVSINNAVLNTFGGVSSSHGGGCGGGRIKIFYNNSISNTSVLISVNRGPNGSSDGTSVQACSPYGLAISDGLNGTVYQTQVTSFKTMLGSLTSDLTLFIGSSAIAYWSHSGTFSTTETTDDFNAALGSYLTTCSYGNGYCDVPFLIYSATPGVINASILNITLNLTTLTLNKTSMNNYLKTCTGKCPIPLNITSNTVGKVQMSGLNVSYYGSGVYNVTAYNGTIKDEYDLYVFYSNFSRKLPYTWTNYILFYPATNSSRNVTPYGQTNAIPIYNVTGKAYERNMSFGIRLNNTVNKCLNITWSNTSAKANGTTINTSLASAVTFQPIYTNLNNTGNFGIWLWMDLNNCNATQAAFFRPNITIKSCCVGCKACY